VQGVGVSLAGADPTPERLDGRLILAEPQQQRPVVEGRQEQPVPIDDRRGDVDHHAFGRERIAPVDLAGGGIQPGHAVARPRHQHAPPGLLDDDRGAVRGLVVQGPPPLLAVFLVHRAQARPVAPARLHNHQLAIDQRGGGDAPDGHAARVMLAEVDGPQDAPVARVVAVEMAHRAQGIGATLVDRDRGPRTCRVADLVGAVVGVAPELLAGSPVEAVDLFHLAGFGLAVHDIHAPVGHGGPVVAGADRRLPAERQALGGELLHNARLAPDSIAGRAAPLRPLVGRHGAGPSQPRSPRQHHQDQELVPRPPKSWRLRKCARFRDRHCAGRSLRHGSPRLCAGERGVATGRWLIAVHLATNT